MKRDYYEVLDVTRDASVDEIRKAFRVAARKHHPDRNQEDPKAEARFKEINEAFQVLSDDSKRRIYDQFGHEGLENPGVESASGFSGIDDVFAHMQQIFSDMFGAPQHGRHGRVHARGRDLKVDFELTFRESIFGCKRALTVKSAVVCPDCGGTCCKSGTKPEVCTGCGGTGEVTAPRGFVMFTNPCGACNGSGHVVMHPCSKCHGQGAVEREREVTVIFPAGIDSGQMVPVPGQGMPGPPGAPSGDLYVTVTVKPDRHFERVGWDLVTPLPIMFTQAVLGGDVKVPVCDPRRDDATATLVLPPCTHPGAPLRIEGLGVPLPNGMGRGALVVIIDIKMPSRLSKRALELVSELNEELESSMTPMHGDDKKKKLEGTTGP